MDAYMTRAFRTIDLQAAPVHHPQAGTTIPMNASSMARSRNITCALESRTKTAEAQLATSRRTGQSHSDGTTRQESEVLPPAAAYSQSKGRPASLQPAVAQVLRLPGRLGRAGL